MATVDLDITSIGIASGDVLIRDIKATITTWTKDGTASGHFDAANAAVEVGDIITFADASTATIQGIYGDGTGAESVRISADHATDANLTSITGLSYAGSSLKVPYGTEASGGLSSAGSATPATGYTRISYGWSIPNNVLLLKLGVYSTATSGTIKFKIGNRVEAGQWNTLTDLGSFTKTSAGYQEFTLATPFHVPAAGTWCLGVYHAEAQGDIYQSTGGSGTSYKSGDLNGDVTGFTENAGYEFHITALWTTALAPQNLYSVHTNSIQVETDTWAGITSIAATQATPGSSTLYHAVSLNKGNAAEAWKVYLSATWRDIVRLSSGTWQYKDAAGDWQSATVNSRLGALDQAFGIAENQLSETALAAITSAQWAEIFSHGTLDLAGGLKASGADVPTLDKWTITYTPAAPYALMGPGSVTVVAAYAG